MKYKYKDHNKLLKLRTSIIEDDFKKANSLNDLQKHIHAMDNLLNFNEILLKALKRNKALFDLSEYNWENREQSDPFEYDDDEDINVFIEEPNNNNK